MAIANSKGKLSSVGNSKIVICLLGVTILYQIAYHVVMHRTFFDSESLDTQCEASRFANSPHCLEMHLFRSWKEEELKDRFKGNQAGLLNSALTVNVAHHTSISEAFDTGLQADVERPRSIILETESRNGGATKWTRIVPWGKFERLYNDTMASTQNKGSLTPWAKNVQASLAALRSRMEALPNAKLRQAEKRQREFEILYNHTLASIHDRSNTIGWSTELKAIMDGFEHRMRNVGKATQDDVLHEFEKLYNETQASLDKSLLTPWAKSIQASQRTMEYRMKALPSSRFREREEWERDFDRLYYQTLASIQNRSNVTRWSRELESVQERFEHRMRKSKHAPVMQEGELDKLYQATLVSLNRSSLTPWGQRVQALQAEMEARMGALRSTQLRQLERQDKRIAKSSDEAMGEGHLLEQIYNLGRELCSSPERRHVPACDRFIHARREDSFVKAQSGTAFSDFGAEMGKHEATLNSSLSLSRVEHDRWLLNFSQTIATFTEQLCADPRRINYKACVRFRNDSSLESALESGSTVDRTYQSALRGAAIGSSERISWSAVVASSQEKVRQQEKPLALTVRSEELRNAKWLAKIPKVACITAVPVGRDSRSRLAEFLKEFREQTYEGSRELVLVYSHSDIEIADVIRENADGTYIKAVAARDGLDPVSTVALRYGAWSSDAEVVASWPFEGKHNPDRLAMQVRALGLAVRPASILKRITLLSDQGDELPEAVLSADFGLEESLVGEKSWMQRHWMPLLGNSRDIIRGRLAGQLVQVDMPELSMYTVTGSHTSTDAMTHLGIPSKEEVLA